jgi:hypothetical protein
LLASHFPEEWRIFQHAVQGDPVVWSGRLIRYASIRFIGGVHRRFGPTVSDFLASGAVKRPSGRAAKRGYAVRGTTRNEVTANIVHIKTIARHADGSLELTEARLDDGTGWAEA